VSEKVAGSAVTKYAARIVGVIALSLYAAVVPASHYAVANLTVSPPHFPSTPPPPPLTLTLITEIPEVIVETIEVETKTDEVEIVVVEVVEPVIETTTITTTTTDDLVVEATRLAEPSTVSLSQQDTQITPLPPPPPPPSTISLEQLDQAAIEAGWPQEEGWWPQMRRIITECENKSLNPHAHNTSDPYGGSAGLAQLNVGWFSYLGEDPSMMFDPVVNLRTALTLRKRIGGFGTGAGWSCFYKLGLDLRWEK